MHGFGLNPLRPFFRLHNLLVHVKGVLKAFAFKNFTSGSCSEDEKVEKFAVDNGDIEVLVKRIEVKDVGE